MREWTPEDITAQTGKSVIVTGGTSGIGLETARQLVKAGAHVIIAADHVESGRAALRDLRGERAQARVEFEQLDLSDLDSVANFAHRMLHQLKSLDVLVNNAGIAGVPKRLVTPQGYELQFATNYLGHFALTARLMPLLRRSQRARVVHVSSLEHRHAQIRWDNLQGELRYDPSAAYAQSKLAQLLFALELHRRAHGAGLSLLSIAAHPGGARTGLFKNGPYLGGTPSLRQRALQLLVDGLGQSASQGALPLLFAATSPDAYSGEYYGPDRFQEVRGNPARARIARQAQDALAAERLWRISEQLTGVELRVALGEPQPRRARTG